MSVAIEYLGQLNGSADRLPRVVPLDAPAELPELFQKLGQSLDEESRSLLLDDRGRLRRSLLVAVNGTQVDPGSRSHVAPGDTVTILSLVAGG